jgi:hypothetical protein
VAWVQTERGSTYSPRCNRLRSFDEQLEVETYFNSKIGSFNSYWIGLRQSWAPAGSGARAGGSAGVCTAERVSEAPGLPCNHYSPFRAHVGIDSSLAADAALTAATCCSPAGTWDSWNFVWEDGRTAPSDIPSSQSKLNLPG